MDSATLVLSQLLGLKLDTSTWVAVAAACIALVGVVGNLLSVERTLRHSRRNLELALAHAEQQAQQRSYDSARDEALRILATASLALDDLERLSKVNPFALESAFAVARQVHRDLTTTHLTFGAYSEPGDTSVDLFGEAILAYRVALDLENDHDATEDEMPAKLRSASEAFDNAAKQVSRASILRAWMSQTGATG